MYYNSAIGGEIMSKKEELAKKGKGFLREFTDFVLKGNVMDMAVGVIIGTAFAGIVTVAFFVVVSAIAVVSLLVHLLKLYPAEAVASIDTSFPYRYDPAPVVSAIPVSFSNTNLYVFLLK